MSTAMWDAKEALIPGGAYDRSSSYNGDYIVFLPLPYHIFQTYGYYSVHNVYLFDL